MRWSSGVIWRHRAFEDFRAECPGGDPALQRLVFDRLDGDLDWLEAQGAVVTQRETGNPRTAGRRFDTGSIVAALAGDVAARHARCASPAGASRSFSPRAASPPRRTCCASTSRPSRCSCAPRPWSTGDGLRLGLAAGGAPDRRHGRVLRPRDARRAARPRALDHRRAAVRPPRRGPRRATAPRFTARTWSEIDVVQWLARRPGARGSFTVHRDALGEPTPVRHRRRPDRPRPRRRRRRPRATATPSPSRSRPRSPPRSAGSPSTPPPAPPTASGRRAPTPAASPPAATPAASPPPSSSAASPPPPPSAPIVEGSVPFIEGDRPLKQLGRGGVSHAFGTGEPFTVGIEEELLLVDPADGHRLADVAEAVLPRVELPDGRGRVRGVRRRAGAALAAGARGRRRRSRRWSEGGRRSAPPARRRWPPASTPPPRWATPGSCARSATSA